MLPLDGWEVLKPTDEDNDQILFIIKNDDIGISEKIYKYDLHKFTRDGFVPIGINKVILRKINNMDLLYKLKLQHKLKSKLKDLIDNIEQ